MLAYAVYGAVPGAGTNDAPSSITFSMQQQQHLPAVAAAVAGVAAAAALRQACKSGPVILLQVFLVAAVRRALVQEGALAVL